MFFKYVLDSAETM